jgi:hypothetical protein
VLNKLVSFVVLSLLVVLVHLQDAVDDHLNLLLAGKNRMLNIDGRFSNNKQERSRSRWAREWKEGLKFALGLNRGLL